ncbi:BsuBI/PstI family type II restriction endonuclease [Brachybacterium sp. sponge]|uniref:BsuBI/PstI family type II restriction endonuclease n=1 Tax=Brachybacterium sp. sponge TaxID=1775432 RepID=UPI0009EEF296|nr:BsuBI/PstI family type II restriction endonuclease [Brachybacterium sp. sponge]
MRTVIDPELAEERLGWIFPRTAFDTTLSGPIAAWAVASLIYMDAVAPADEDPPAWARPTTILWQQQNVLDGRTEQADREEWRTAALRGRKAYEDLLVDWELEISPRYRENSRETLRDEVFKEWLSLNVMRQRPGLSTTSNLPRWALEGHFADLFDPTLEGDELTEAIGRWTDDYLDAGARLRAHRGRESASSEYAVTVSLPDGQQRTLEHGQSSEILKGVIEEWAPRKLVDPVVLTISEPGDKVYVGDQRTLAVLGVQIDVASLLPDAVLVELGTKPAEFWIVEAVYSDGPIHERRKAELLEWAAEQRINPDSCRFLTAFSSRNASPAKRRLKDIAAGTFVWYLDEPGLELELSLIEDGSEKVIPLRPSAP